MAKNKQEKDQATQAERGAGRPVAGDVRLPPHLMGRGAAKQVDLAADPTVQANPLYSEHGRTRDELPENREQVSKQGPAQPGETPPPQGERSELATHGADASLTDANRQVQELNQRRAAARFQNPQGLPGTGQNAPQTPQNAPRTTDGQQEGGESAGGEQRGGRGR